MPRFVDEEQIAAVVEILSLEVLRPELQLDLVVAYLTGVHCSLAQIHRDLLRWPDGQYHGFGRLGHCGRLDHHSGTCQLLGLFGALVAKLVKPKINEANMLVRT